MESRRMSSRLYKAAAAGNFLCLLSETVSEERLRSDLLCLTHEESNCLHIAAMFGREEFVRNVASLCSSLLYRQNVRGDNPLRVAARAGHLGVVKLLTDSFRELQRPPPQSIERGRNRETPGQGNEENNSTDLADSVQPPQTPQSQSTGGNSGTAGEDDIISEKSLREAEEGERPSLPILGTPSSQSESTTGDMVVKITSSEWPSLPIWRTQNHDGNTALHEALRRKHGNVAFNLLDLDGKMVVLIVNSKTESPLYLAAEAGFAHVVSCNKDT
ncbi:uncharacterized protein LOC122638902 [Telopea speciosissima]|uniref:uncharacterized protein LOC122638902 n=1 Tax=Telopea speciosissima TaxID=54955 RepID=UPI001CC4BAFD|nr:uncharacterized protein LOC122638902 [Telopea speciosissima]